MSDDLFEGVKPPKEERESPQPAAREAAPATSKDKSSGVPLSRLWWWAVPLLLVVLAVVLWSVSVWLLVAVAAAAVVGVIVSALVWWWQRRSGRSSRTRSWTSSPTGRTGGSGRSLGLGGRSSGAGGGGRRTGSGTGRSSRTGSRMNPGNWFKGGSGRSAKGSGTATRGGQSAGSGGRSGRGGRLRSLLGSGQRGSGSTSGGRTSGSGAGTKSRHGSGSHGKGGSTAGGGRWSRSPANPATWFGPRRAAAKSEREAQKKKAKGKTSDKNAEATSGRKRRWPWGKKRNVVEPDAAQAKDTDAKSEDKRKPETSKKTSAKGATADPKKPADAQETTKQEGHATVTDKKLKDLADAKARPKTAAEKLKEMADARTRGKGTQSNSQQQGNPRAGNTFDDMSFQPDPQWKPTPRPKKQPLNVDDGGFISPVIVKQPKVKAHKGTNNTQRKDIMSDRTVNPYVEQIDTSTPETFRATANEVAKKLLADANTKEQDAAALRRQAAALEGNGLADAAQELTREASGMDRDVENRRAAAAAFGSV